ncbi:MAG: MFS transporter, partial [Pyrinomonadaceae bacterium]|nr:MFS transporter [Pyrinomonadaceae bacterium]
LTLMIMLPFIGYLLDKIDARKVIFFGLFGTMLAMWNFTTVISLQVDYYTLATARVFQSFSGAFLAVSVNTAAYTDVPPDKNNSASALLNLARNSGASLSIALVVTIITRQTQIHTNYLGQHINNYNPNFTQLSGKLSQTLQEQGLTAAQAASSVTQIMWESVLRQAGIKAILDTYFVYIALALAVMPMILLLKRRKKSGDSGGH